MPVMAYAFVRVEKTPTLSIDAGVSADTVFEGRDS